MLHLKCRLLRPHIGRCGRGSMLNATSIHYSDSSHHRHHVTHGRSLITLAIETSCDDTAVAVLKRDPNEKTTSLLFNRRVSSDNRAFKGINPVVAVASHNASLAPLVREALESLPLVGDGENGEEKKKKKEGEEEEEEEKMMKRKLPDFVCATRGPGIMANLAVGLNFAKGLAVGWGVPLVGVHHMQAHALTPRLVRALETRLVGDGDGANKNISSSPSLQQRNLGEKKESPAFPFLSLLVSGGHTQLVLSSSLTHHRIIATTSDIAIGNLLDQTARIILPPHVLQSSPDVMYGRMLESFAFPPGFDSTAEYESFFQPATSRHQEIEDVDTGYGWSIPLPFKQTRKLAYSFSSIHMHVHRILESNTHMSDTERRSLARHTLRAAFQHLVSRLILSLEDDPTLRDNSSYDLKTLVVAGGVASNRFLMHVLRTTLAARGFGHMEIVAPPVELCTDNAAMIAWAGMEMYEAGWYSDLSVLPIAKWPMDPEAGDGIMGVDGWLRRGHDGEK